MLYVKHYHISSTKNNRPTQLTFVSQNESKLHNYDGILVEIKKSNFVRQPLTPGYNGRTSMIRV